MASEGEVGRCACRYQSDNTARLDHETCAEKNAVGGQKGGSTYHWLQSPTGNRRIGLSRPESGRWITAEQSNLPSSPETISKSAASHSEFRDTNPECAVDTVRGSATATGMSSRRQRTMQRRKHLEKKGRLLKKSEQTLTFDVDPVRNRRKGVLSSTPESTRSRCPRIEGQSEKWIS
jgi:hypothetical protein